MIRPDVAKWKQKTDENPANPRLAFVSYLA